MSFLRKGSCGKEQVKNIVFFDLEYGEFKSAPKFLICFSWKKGLTGHPKRGTLARSKLKKRKIIDQNGKIYESAKDVVTELQIPISTLNKNLSKKSKHAKGYVFKYLDEKNEP